MRTKENCMAIIGEVLQDLDCGIGLESIDRVYRIGPVRMGNDGKSGQQTIVKFKPFADCTMLYITERSSRPFLYGWT